MDKKSSKTSAAGEAKKSTSTTIIQNNATNTCRVRRVLQNFLLIWLDANIDESNDDFKHSLIHLRHIVASITTFTDPKECTNFLHEIQSEKVFMIVSGSLGQNIVPKIYTWSQVHSIYVFCNNRSVHEKWAKKILKIKGVHTEIESICEALKKDSARCDRALISISFRGIDASFMYTQLIKEALLEIDDDDASDKKSIKDLAEYCRLQNDIATDEIEKFEREYHQHTPIWWYTAPFFIYTMLNRALRLLDVDIILKMGFFIRHLHRHIKQLYHEQQSKMRTAAVLTVYRGQGLSIQDFEKMKQSKGGFMSFNNFLSTSRDRNLSLNAFTRPAALQDPDSVVNSDMSEYPKAVSFYERALDIHQNSSPSYHPDLATSYNNIGNIYSIMGEYSKALVSYEQALDIYRKSLPSDHPHFAQSYNNMGMVYQNMGEYTKALSYFKQALDICQKSLPPNHQHFAQSYNNIGILYENMGDYAKALSFFERSLDVKKKTLPSMHPYIAKEKKNIERVKQKM
ncbi:unnamed protein product [Rotaria sordida]|uniref:Kinesin light chain n=1 Tax=Rotaria sordida TaxID=392033 RepID=A0A819CAM9_9BILA|nr:unnamed protein product [Rotaria sordida]CAF3817595.1 unnamed protein product [Rotaria sordida]